MSSKKEKQSGVVSAWAVAVLQNSGDLPAEGTEILEYYSKEIINDMASKGGISENIDDFLELYDVPEIVYHLAEENEALQEINRRIKSLSPEFQKLLYFIIKDFDPENACQSMNYKDQVEYWEKRLECIKLFTGGNSVLKDDTLVELNKVYDKYKSIRDDFLTATDILSEQKNKQRSRKKWLFSGPLVLIIPLLFFLLIYPRIIQKDFQELFNYGTEKSAFNMTMDSVDLLDEMILNQEQYTPESYWLLALKALQNGDAKDCRIQLNSLKSSDPELFDDRGRYILRRLKR